MFKHKCHFTIRRSLLVGDKEEPYLLCRCGNKKREVDLTMRNWKWGAFVPITKAALERLNLWPKYQYNDGYNPTDKFLMSQIKDARAGNDIECVCGRRLPIWALYRCLYCGTWMCQSCAEHHFGKSRGEYNWEHFKERMAQR